MTIEDIIRGESKNAEFKEMPPRNSEKYTKTVVAFANSQGGRLVFGVADETREIVGIDEAILFQTMDSITNAISDSCVPQIVPEIEPVTIQGKTVIVVTVSPGAHRPYYLKSKGKENGTYIRVAGTSRLASPEKIKDLEMEGAKISWDELTCVGFKVTEKAIKKLCKDMNARRKLIQEQRGQTEKLPTVTRTNLENWKLLKKVDDEYLASNAFALLTSDCFQFSKIQCAVFKGTDRAVFLDKREYTGPLYEQIDEALGFVLRNIRLGAKFEGVQRKEIYELPVDAIREMIVNAECHRNMTDESCVQVAIYDDRLEVTSPGGLYNGLTFEEAMGGHSKLRNRAIANVFSQIGLIEAWGTGLQRIRNAAKEYGLPDVEFIEMPESFRVNLYRTSSPMNSIGETSVEHRQNIGVEMIDTQMYLDLNSTQIKIIELLSANSNMTGADLSESIGISKRNIEVNLKKLKEKGVLVRHGSSKGGYWEVKAQNKTELTPF
jgi:predicted HTH transcriptional regulator